MDLLAKEWLEGSDALRSPENRIYLLDQVLPCLVMGLEKLLVAAEGQEDRINSLNWLGQWLSRNNPKYMKKDNKTSYAASFNSSQLEMRSHLATEKKPITRPLTAVSGSFAEKL